MATPAVIGALRVVLSMDAGMFNKGRKEFETDLERMGRQMDKFGKKMGRIGLGMTAALTAPIALLGRGMLKAGGDFEAAMNRVQAASGATASQFQQMREMAIQLGADTIFSASESAAAMEMLVKNGLNASQILDGALSSSLALAAASSTSMSSAADVATDVMISFGKEARELAGLVDGITGTVLRSKFSFDDYRLALGQAGGVAGNLGVQFDEFNAVLATTASAFASGSDAGTSFKTFLTRLVPQSKVAADTMKKLGLEFFDETGKMKTMAGVAQELKEGLGNLADESRNQALKDIFGVDAMRTAILLSKQGAEGIEAMQKEIAKVSAMEQAEIRMKGLNGALEQMAGAFETLQIRIGDSGILKMAEDFVRWVADLFESISKLNPNLLYFGTIVAGLLGSLGPAALAIGAIAVAFGHLAPALATAGIAIRAFIASTGPIGLLIAAASTLAIAWMNSDVDLKTVWNSIKSGLDKISTSLKQVKSDAEMVPLGFDGFPGIDARLDSTTAKVQKLTDVMSNFAASQQNNPLWNFAGLSGGLGNALDAGLDSEQKKINSLIEGATALDGWKTRTLNLMEMEKDLVMELATPYEEYAAQLERIAFLQDKTAISAANANRVQVAAASGLASEYLGVAGQISGALGQVFDESKGIAIATAIINTAQAVTKALADYGPTPFGFASAAAAVASGAAQIATMRSTSPGSGTNPRSVSGGGGGSQAQPSQQSSNRSLLVRGVDPASIYSGSQLKELVGSINEFVADGGVLIATEAKGRATA